MNIILFIMALVISFIAVRVGAIAFQLTGLEWSLAKFQALSCFSGTGFTTREAELIVGHPRRRQIASILMVLGNAGLVTLVATFANSIRPRINASASFWNWLLGGMGPLLNLVIIIMAVYITFRIFTHSHMGRKVTDFLRSRVQASGIVEKVSFEELVVSTGGYGVIRTEVMRSNSLVGKTLSKSGLRAKDITVLVIRRGGDSIPNPSPDIMIQTGDKLLCFGNLDHMKKEFEHPVDMESGEHVENDGGDVS